MPTKLPAEPGAPNLATWPTCGRVMAMLHNTALAKKTAQPIQMAMTMPAATRLMGRSIALLAASRCSAIISGGMSRTTNMMPSGTMMRSPRYPSTGMKSGIKSMLPAQQVRMMKCQNEYVRIGRTRTIRRPTDGISLVVNQGRGLHAIFY